MINVGDSFLIVNPKNNIPHLYVVISKPNNNNQILMVNVTKYKTWKDNSCILIPNDHPFIKQKSVINYSDAIEARSDILEQLANCGRPDVRKERPFNKNIVTKIQDGAKKSNSLPKKFHSYFRLF